MPAACAKYFFRFSPFFYNLIYPFVLEVELTMDIFFFIQDVVLLLLLVSNNCKIPANAGKFNNMNNLNEVLQPTSAEVEDIAE